MSSGTLALGSCFGCEHLGRLTRVMVHKPGDELRIIDAANHRDWLFDSVPDLPAFQDEHECYCEFLRLQGVEVLELADWIDDAEEKLAYLPNITYMHDIAVISDQGAILSSMAWDGRRNEHLVVREALRNVGIPILWEFDEPTDAFEGCLLPWPHAVLVAETERHSSASVRKFLQSARQDFEEVIYLDVPKARRYMHPDTIYNRITENLALVYLPAIQGAYLYRKDVVEPIDFSAFMHARGVELVNVSDAEQRRLACSFVPLEPGVVFHYDTALDPATRRLLSRKGVEFIFFHPEAMRAGGGSLRCLTLRLHRTGARSPWEQ